jgi:twitching motility protein PilT
MTPPTAPSEDSPSIHDLSTHTVAPSNNPYKFSSIKEMVSDAYHKRASDIHIRVGQVPRFRIRGEMVIMDQYPKVTADMYQVFLKELLPLPQLKQFAQTKELDTAIVYPGLVRCRVNCFDTLTGGAIVLRIITLEVPTIKQLRLKPVLCDLAMRPQGLILVTGPTGCGKSTTLAAMIRHINENTCKHIVTIEDPVEFVHTSQMSLISQREVGLHTYDFHKALRSALREDPDVIMLGEMRDRITVETALQAAQTGHLVLGTLHTRNAIAAYNRLLNFFEPREHVTVRYQILDSLVAVVAQLLLPTTDNRRVAVQEILINTPTVKDYLLKGEEEEVVRLMADDATGQMQLMNHALYEQLMEGRLTIDEALKVSPEPADLERQIRTGGLDGRSSREWMNKQPKSGAGHPL